MTHCSFWDEVSCSVIHDEGRMWSKFYPNQDILPQTEERSCYEANYFIYLFIFLHVCICPELSPLAESHPMMLFHWVLATKLKEKLMESKLSEEFLWPQMEACTPQYPNPPLKWRRLTPTAFSSFPISMENKSSSQLRWWQRAQVALWSILKDYIGQKLLDLVLSSVPDTKTCNSFSYTSISQK